MTELMKDSGGKIVRAETRIWKLRLGKISTISSLVLSAWRRWFDLKLEGGNCRSQLSLSWLLEIGGAPALLRAVAGKPPATKPEYLATITQVRTHSISMFPASDAGLRASLEAGKLS